MSFVLAGMPAKEKNTTLQRAKHEKLKEVVGMINELYGADISVPLAFQKAQLFVGELKSGQNLLELVDSLRFSVEEIPLFFGIGTGKLTQSKETQKAKTGLTLALEALAETQKGSIYQRGTICFLAETNLPWQTAVNDTLRLCDHLEGRWVKSQRSFVGNMITEFGYDNKVTQREMARLEETTPQKLNSRIQSSGYYQYIALRKSLSNALEKEWS